MKERRNLCGADPAAERSVGRKGDDPANRSARRRRKLCGSADASRARLMLTGVASVTQIRVEAKPGRAGSLRTSDAGPSSIASDLPPASSIVTILRTGRVLRIIGLDQAEGSNAERAARSACTPAGAEELGRRSGQGRIDGDGGMLTPRTSRPSSRTPSGCRRADCVQPCQLPSCTTTSPGFIEIAPLSSMSTRSPASRMP